MTEQIGAGVDETGRLMRDEAGFFCSSAIWAAFSASFFCAFPLTMWKNGSGFRAFTPGRAL